LKLVYIASPLRGDYNQNIKNAVEYCKIACDLGVLPLAPHIIFSQWCNDTIPAQREQGLKLGLELLSKADELWVMGTQVTEGITGELAFAHKRGIPFFTVKQPHDPDYYPISTDENPLLGAHSCVDESKDMNYKGQVIVLSFDVLKPEYRSQPNQLWLCTGGFGADPDARGRRVYVTNLFDGEKTSFYRQDFAGIVRPEALERAQCIYAKEQDTTYSRDEESDEELEA
jgi:hypothetical protein